MSANERASGGGEGPADGSRRTMLKAGIGVLGGGLALIPVIPAIGYLTYPLDHEVTSSGGGFIPVGKRGGLAGDAPVKVDLYADRVDAWSRVRNVKVGSAWVIEIEGKLTAFSTVCPHLGCAVDFDPEEKKFKCPCHRSAFTLKGEVEEGPAPRPLDTLEVQEDGELVAIRFQRFRQGIAAKEEA